MAGDNHIIEQFIAKNIDEEMLGFSLFYKNNTNSDFLVEAFLVGGHCIILSTEKTQEIINRYKDPAVVYSIAPGNYCINYNLSHNLLSEANKEKESTVLSWCISNLDKRVHWNYLSQIYLSGTINSNMDFFHKKQKDGVFAEIIKLMDGNNLSFALLVANHTSRKIVLTDFYGDGNQVKLKFPNGRIFTPPLKKDAKNMELKPGESKTFKIELDQLLKGNKDFSMKDFEYGLTELVWEIKLDKEQVITRNFWLVKFNGELPEAHASSGYKLDGPLIMETFRDKKISALPAPKAYFGNKEDAGSETKETSETKESSQK